MCTLVGVILSTGYNPQETVHLQRTDKDGTESVFPFPTAIAKNNEIMGGLDQFDQLRICNAIECQLLRCKICDVPEDYMS